MNKIEKIKQRKKLSYNDIARESGLSAPYVYYLAKNKRTNPSLEAMKKISLALGERVEKVFDLNAREEGVS